MKPIFKAGAAATALTIVACLASPVSAGGLFDRSDRGMSTKDDYVPYMRPVSAGAGPCYFRADVGYSISSDPQIKWPVNNVTNTYAAGTTQADIDAGIATPVSTTTTYVGDAVSGTSAGNSWFGEAGFGCGSGSRGFRAELMLGMRGGRDIDGQPANFEVRQVVPALPDVVVAPTDDPLHTSLRSYTAMLNIYKDLGNYGGFTPYVGAGIGVAYNKLSEVYFTGNPNLTNRIRGNSDLSFAWSLMAGVGYQVSERAILDLGYRFIDMGSISSGRADSGGFVNPAVDIDKLYAHEIKIGLRYHFGGGSAQVASYK